MNTLTLPALLVFFFSLNKTAIAQSDTSRLDIGSNTLIRIQTQYLTIKGEDIQHMPFTSLGEAIQSYFSGVYTDDNTIAYIIDGSLSNNVNAYSIYDIESVTFIQDAQTLLNTLSPAQHIVLIKTKLHHKGQPAITADINSYFVKRRKQEGGKFIDQDAPTFFHQYYLSAAHSFRHTDVGASVNFIHNAFPVDPDTKTISSTPFRLNRFGINAWISSQISRQSLLTIRINSSNQDSSMQYTYGLGSSQDSRQLKGGIFNIFPSLNLSTKFSSSWSNELNISYLNSYDKQSADRQSSEESPSIQYADFKNSRINISQFLLRDQVVFTKKIHAWTINPTLNATIRFGTTQLLMTDRSYMNSIMGLVSSTWSKSPTRDVLITPGININYHQYISVSGGFQHNLNQKDYYYEQRHKVLPFASLMSDVLKIINPVSAVSVKLFASVASSDAQIYHQYYLPLYSYENPGAFTNEQSTISPHSQRHRSLQTFGSIFSIANNKLHFSYNYEFMKYYIPIRLYSIGGSILWKDNKIDLRAQRFSIMYNVNPTNGLNHGFVFTLYSVRSSMKADPSDNLNPIINQDEYPRQGLSGGLVYNLSFKKITAGLSCVYYLNEETYSGGNYSLPAYVQYVIKKSNSFLLQNIYLGYKIRISKADGEIFASARNLFQNRMSTIQSGYIAYHGLGIKIEF